MDNVQRRRSAYCFLVIVVYITSRFVELEDCGGRLVVAERRQLANAFEEKT
jgi:hypothetical protein